MDELGFGGVARLFSPEKSWPEVGFVLTQHSHDSGSGVRMRDPVFGDPSFDGLLVDVDLLR